MKCPGSGRFVVAPSVAFVICRDCGRELQVSSKKITLTLHGIAAITPNHIARRT